MQGAASNVLMKSLGISAALALILLEPANPQVGQYPTGGGQYPQGGQYPPGRYPPGGYPPGSYPGGQGGGVSLPQRKKKNDKNSKDAVAPVPTITAEGYTLVNEEKKLVIATDDGRTITMAVNPKTVFSKGGADITAAKIEEGSKLRVAAAEDDEAFLTAVKVELLADPAPGQQKPGGNESAGGNETKETAPPARPVDPTTAAELAKPAASDAPDRPILRRRTPADAARSQADLEQTGPNQPAVAASDDGQAAVQKQAKIAKAMAAKSKPASDDFTITAADVQRTPTPGDDALITRTKDWAETFAQGLPNYICQQLTTRSIEVSRSAGWQAQDVVTAKIVYENGHENYREITVGGKRTDKDMMSIGGSTSTGEFSAILQGLFLSNRAQFKFYQSTILSKAPAAIYDFKVALRASDWTIVVGGQSLRPAYSGSVWLDKETSQVRRIEMQADNIPKDFPDDSIQSAVDYAPVRLGTAEFLLPVHAENISCQRGSTICSKNEIDFRDYHKYSGESTIVYK